MVAWFGDRGTIYETRQEAILDVAELYMDFHGQWSERTELGISTTEGQLTLSSFETRLEREG